MENHGFETGTIGIEYKLTLEIIPTGAGVVLDLGGGNGTFRQPIQERGYHYINLDIQHGENGEPSLIGDGNQLPFKDNCFDMVISKDSLEHVRHPQVVVKEVHRVLKKSGLFVLMIPFMYPVHGKEDFHRYTPLGLHQLLHDFEIVTLESPLWLFTLFALILSVALWRIGLGFLIRPIRQFCGWLDRLFMRGRTRPAGFAPWYRIAARKK